MRDGGGAGGGAEQQVPLPEEPRPGVAHAVADFIGRNPVPMQPGIGAEHARPVAVLLRGQACGFGLFGGKDLRRDAGAGGAAEQMDIGPHGQGGVDIRAGGEGHRGPLRRQRLRQAAQQILDGGIHLRIRIVQHHRDPVVAEPRMPRRRQGEGEAAAFDLIRAGDEGERRVEVPCAAGHRADHRDIHLRHIPPQRMPAGRAEAPGRLVAEDAAVMRRVADGGTDVAAEFEPGEAGRKRGGRPAGGPAGGAREVPGVVGGAVDRVEALPIRQRDRHIGLAEDHRPGVQQPLHRKRIGRGDRVLQRREAPMGRQAGDVEAFLHRHRQAVQRPPILPAGQRRIGRIGPRPGAVEIPHHHGVGRPVQPFDAGDEMLQQLPAADAAGAEHGGEVEGGGVMECGHGGRLRRGAARVNRAAPARRAGGRRRGRGRPAPSPSPRAGCRWLPSPPPAPPGRGSR